MSVKPWHTRLDAMHETERQLELVSVVPQNIVESLMVEPSRHRRKYVNKRTIKTS